MNFQVLITFLALFMTHLLSAEEASDCAVDNCELSCYGGFYHMQMLRDWSGSRILIRHASITGIKCNSFPASIKMVDLTGSTGALGEDCKFM